MSWRIRSQALCNSLCNALHSARPQNPDVERNWWGDWIRPRPPHVHSSLERSGSDPVPPRSDGGGSADGRKRGAGTEQQRNRTDKELGGTAAASETAETEKGAKRSGARKGAGEA